MISKIFGSPDTSTRIVLPWNCFQTTYISKICTSPWKKLEKFCLYRLFRILLMFQFLNFTTIFTRKNFNVSKFFIQFPCEKNNFSLIHPTQITSNSFWKALPSSLVRPTVKKLKVTFKQTVKNNDYLIFMIFFVFNLVFFLELKTREGRLVISPVYMRKPRTDRY